MLFRDPKRVGLCLYVLSQAIQDTVPTFSGPFMARTASSTRSPGSSSSSSTSSDDTSDGTEQVTDQHHRQEHPPSIGPNLNLPLPPKPDDCGAPEFLRGGNSEPSYLQPRHPTPDPCVEMPLPRSLSPPPTSAVDTRHLRDESLPRQQRPLSLPCRLPHVPSGETWHDWLLSSAEAGAGGDGGDARATPSPATLLQPAVSLLR